MSFNLSIVMKAAAERGLIESHSTFVTDCLTHLSEEGILNCSLEKVLGMFDFGSVSLTSKRSVAAKAKKTLSRGPKLARTAKPTSLIPFCGEIVEDWCQAVRFNHGLHTQCTNGQLSDGDFCKTCSKQAECSSTDKPPYGDIRERVKLGLLYRDPKGKQTVPFANVAKKMKLDIEAAKETATTMGWTIPEEQLVLRVVSRGRPKTAAVSDSESEGDSTKKRGRPKKIKTKVIQTQDDLIAKLVAEASNELLGDQSGNESDSSTASTQSKAELKAEKKAKKKAEKEAEKVAKTELKEAEKVAKTELKEAEKVAKAELKVALSEAKEVEKLAKAKSKAAEKVAKAEAKEAEKLAKVEAKEAEKVAKAKAKEVAKLAKVEVKKAEKLAKAEAKEAIKLEISAKIAAENAEPELETASIESEADSSDDEEEADFELSIIEVDGKKYQYDEHGEYASIKHLVLTEEGEPYGIWNEQMSEITVCEFE
jgi:hypothetical protein